MCPLISKPLLDIEEGGGVSKVKQYCCCNGKINAVVVVWGIQPVYSVWAAVFLCLGQTKMKESFDGCVCWCVTVSGAQYEVCLATIIPGFKDKELGVNSGLIPT